MGHMPGYRVVVVRNGEDISNHVVRGSTSVSSDKPTRSWEIEFAEPMDLATTDKWSIRRKVAGYEQVWAEDALAVNFGGEHGVDSRSDGNAVRLKATRRITGETSSEEYHFLVNYCLPKTLVFVSNDWLLSHYPTAQLKDGILVYGPINMGVWGTISTQARIYDDRLPGKEFESDSFECILGVQTHHAIAKYLAHRVGFELQVNTPDVDLIDTMTIQSGTTWLSAIQGIFNALWFPTIEVIGKTIYVADILADGTNEAIPAIQRIRLTNDAIASASLNRGGPDKENPLDHLIITGRRTKDTNVLQPETPDYTPIELPELDLKATLTVPSTIDFGAGVKRQAMNDYVGSFGAPGEAFDVTHLKNTVNTISYYVEEAGGRRRYIPISETADTYDLTDTLVARKEVFHYYAKGYVPVRTLEKFSVRTHMPGTDVMALTLLSCKTTLHQHFKKPLNMSQTQEIYEGLVLYDEGTIPVGGVVVPYKDAPIVLADALRADTTRTVIDTSPKTTQRVLQMTLSQKTTTISRTDDDLLVKNEQTYDTLTGHTRFNSQILENPLRDRKTKKTDHVFRAEYFCGTDGHVVRGGGGATTVGETIGGYGPCFHPPKTINHQDICTTELADEVAERAFARKNIDRNHEWSLKLPNLPLPIESLAMLVTLPDFQVKLNGQAVTVPGGDYVLKSVSESFACQEVGNGNTVSLNVETTLNVKKRY